MPGYHGENDGDRYRGRGGMGWGPREGGSSRDYDQGAGSGMRYSDRYGRWGEEGDGSRRGPQRGYKDSYDQHRYRDDYYGSSSSSHHYPYSWHDGGRAGDSYSRRSMGDRHSGSDLLKSLSELGQHFSGKESRIALNIIKTVLGSDTSEHDQWDYGPARKMRRTDWDGARSPHMHKYSYRERPYPSHQENRRRGRGGVNISPSSSHCYRKMSNTQLREMEMARSEMPYPDRKKTKDLKRKTSGVKKEREGDEKEKTSAEETAKEEGNKSEEKEEKNDKEENEKDENDKDEGEKEAGESGEAKKTEEVDAEKEEETTETKEGEETTETKEGEEEDTDAKNKNESEEAKDPNLAFPRTALKCHMCDMTKFPNIKAYLSHLGSKNHERISHLFHSRCAAAMDLLIAQAKLANKRNEKRSRKNYWCYQCDCYMNTNPKTHAHTAEHTLVSRYMKVQCCNYVYNRANVEEHRLSMRHLKNQIGDEEAYQSKKEKMEQLKDVSKEEELAFHTAMAELKQKGLEREKEEGLEELTSENLPPYDPERPLGLGLLYKVDRFQCDVCCHLDINSPRHARYHFRSIEHYQSICNYLTGILEAKELERKKEEEEKAAKEKEEAEKNKKEGGEEEDEDMTNMETVDVADEDAGEEQAASKEEQDSAAKVQTEGEKEQCEGEEEDEGEGEEEQVQKNQPDEETHMDEDEVAGDHEEEEEYVEEMEDYGDEDDARNVEGIEEEDEDYEEGVHCGMEEEEDA